MRLQLSSLDTTQRLTLAVGGLLASLAVLVLLSWIFSFEQVHQINSAWAPMQPNTALCFLLIGTSLLAFVFKWNYLGQWTSGTVVLFTVVTLVQYIFSFDLGIDRILGTPENAVQTSHPGRIPPNTCLCFLFVSLGLLLLTRKIRIAVGPSPLGLLGLFVFSISFIALFGYAFGVEVAYGWGDYTRMAFLSAVGLLLLSAELVVLGWNKEVTKTVDLHELWPWMKLYSFVGVLVASVVSALLGVLLLYAHTQREIHDTFSEIVSNKAHTVDQYAKNIIESTNDISQHDEALSALMAHTAGAISENQLVERTSEALRDVVEGRPEIRGLIRYDPGGKPIVALGMGIPEKFLMSKRVQSKVKRFFGPFRLEGELFLLLTNPIGEDAHLGSDIMLVKADGLGALLEPRVGVFGRINLFLGIYSEDSLELFEFSNRGPNDRSRLLAIAPEIGTGLQEAFLGKSGIVVPGLEQRSRRLVAYAPVPSVRWAVLARASTEKLYGAANEQLVNAILAALLLALAGSLTLELVFRSMIERATKLSADLKTELVHRSMAEKALKESQKEIKKSLHEKELLLGEIHHRVKNNLQIVSTIFNLQRRRSTDSAVLHVLQEGQNRIRSIALLHESLYKTGEFSHIDARAYLGDVVSHAIRSIAADATIDLEMIADKAVYLDIDQAIPCGLIVNELITNAVKHAFPEQRLDMTKKLVVTIVEVAENSEVRLQVRDNGVGLPPTFSLEDTKTLGSRIITSLSRQLKARLEVSSLNGAIFTLTFPSPPTKGTSDE